MVAPIQFHKDPHLHNPNVYRLIGKNEDALTYALGHLMAVDGLFLLEVLKVAGVLPRIRGKRYGGYLNDYRIHLQEQRDAGPSGRRDVVIESGHGGGLRVVIEAKIGKGQPNPCQLLRYSGGCDCGRHPPEKPQAWGARDERFIVALTRDPLDSNVCLEVRDKLRGSGIELRTLQWHQILETALDRYRRLPHHAPQSLFAGEFVNFFKEHYDMKFYDAEVLIADVDARNARIYWDGHMYVWGMRRSAPLYFAPYFTRENPEEGLSYISRVPYVEIIDHHDKNGAFTTFDYYFSLRPNLNRRWQSHWKTGLRLIFERIAEDEAKGKKWGSSGRVYFLDEPVKIRQVPLKKRNFPLIPFNYGENLSVADLIMGRALGGETSL